MRYSRPNPSAAVLRSMIERAQDRRLRGLVAMNGDLFWWDAYYATHQTAAMELGIEYSEGSGPDRRLFATLDYLDGTITIDHGSDEFAEPLRRLAVSASNDYDFRFTGWRSSWSADEFVEQLDEIA